MKLQHLTVIFLIIVIPIILVASYYVQMQIDTINLQNSYNTKLIDSTREAIESFEINTVEWDNTYSAIADTKRRDITASINTFINSLANNFNISGTSKNLITTYIPAITYNLYDGIYIYTPTNVPKIKEDDNGVAELNVDRTNRIFKTKWIGNIR